MKKLTIYLFFLLCSISSFAGVIEVDLTGETCVTEFNGYEFVYTGSIVDGPPLLCNLEWEYRVVGGQIINFIEADGTVNPYPPGRTTHLGKTKTPDQVTIEWLDMNSCNSVQFIGRQGGLVCINREDEETLKVQTGSLPPPPTTIQGPANIVCGSNAFSVNITRGCNEYTSFEWRITGGPSVTTTSPNANLMVNTCPGEFTVSVFASGSCSSFTYEQVFTCSGLGSPVPVINMEDTYCCKKDIVLNTAGTTGEEGYLISICQEDPAGGPCINWRSTGWIQEEVDLNVDLLDIWNKEGTSNWIFWPNNSYTVTLALHNRCDDWVAVSKTFEVLSIDPSFVINDSEGFPVEDNGSVCQSVRDVTMDPSASSCGDEYLIMICQVDPAGGECLNWRSTGWIEGDVSGEGPIDLLSIWNRDGASNWLFWSGQTFTVTLVLRDECDTWESYSQTFTVDGSCFTGGGGDDRDNDGSSDGRKGAVQQLGANSDVEIYPTLINSSVNYLTVVVPDLLPNSTLFLYDVQGRVIQQNQINDQSSEVSIQDLEAGLYFAILYENGKPIHQSKLVVSK